MQFRVRTLLCGAAVLLCSTAHAQLASQDVADFIKDATGVDINAPQPAWNMSDAFNIYQLKKEDLVRWDNPRIKVELHPEWIVDDPPMVDKRDFRVLQSDDYMPGIVNVQFKPGVTKEQAQAIHAQLGAQIVSQSELVPELYTVRIGGTVPATIHAYLDRNAVLYAEPEYRMEPADALWNDPDQGLCWGLSTDFDASWACDAWGDSFAGALVAIIDSGTQIDHPDLAANIWVNPGEIPGNGIDDDSNGYVDDINGWNMYLDYLESEPFLDGVGGSDVSSCGDDHGTHVAGTVGARGNNGVGTLGVSPFCKLMILACNGPGTCGDPPAFDTCCGLYLTRESVEYAVVNGAKISSNSYGGSSYAAEWEITLLAAQAAGHIFVAAAGNGGDDVIGDDNDITPHYPASYPQLNVISVAAIDEDGDLASFSNYGATSVDLAAPGVDVYSTVDGSGYGYKSGTSMATPHVAGTVSLVMGAYPELNWLEVRNRVVEGVQFNSALLNKTVSEGTLRATFALGVWVDPNVDPNDSGQGSFFKPYQGHQTATAETNTPTNGTLNFKPGSIDAASVNFILWNKAMTLRARGGTVTIGD